MITTLLWFCISVSLFCQQEGSDEYFSDQKLSETLTCSKSVEFQMLNAEYIELTIETFDDTGYSIVLDDSTTINANSSERLSYLYATPYSGKIHFVGLNGMKVKSIIISGGFAFDIQELYGFMPRVESITINAGSQCYGNMGSKPPSLTYLDFQTGVFFGNFNKSRLKNVERLRVVDGNQISFDISDFDISIKYIGVTGMNTAYGQIDSLNYPKLNHFDLKGNNTITGDLGAINSALPPIFNLSGNNSSNSYTAGNLSFISAPSIFIIDGPNSKLSSEQIDDLLIDLDNASTQWKSPGLLILKGNHDSPTSASAAARASLQLKGATISTN